MRFKIYAGLGGGFGGANYLYTGDYDSAKEALEDAYRCAVEEYQSYEGMHGILSWADCKEALQDDFTEDDIDEDEEMVNDYYTEEIEGWIDYFIEPADENE